MRVVGLELLVTALGGVLRLAAQSYALMLAGTACIGLTACFLSAGASKILAGYFGARNVGAKMGVFTVASTLGMTVALATTSLFGSVALIAAAMVLTGNFLGGIVPVRYAMPVQFEEVGPALAGTAGGVLTTVQVLGAILLPSFVSTPIAGGSYPLLFLLDLD